MGFGSLLGACLSSAEATRAIIATINAAKRHMLGLLECLLLILHKNGAKASSDFVKSLFNVLSHCRETSFVEAVRAKKACHVLKSISERIFSQFQGALHAVFTIKQQSLSRFVTFLRDF
jgi:hypothetical protein